MVEAPSKLVPDTLGGNKRTEISEADVKQALVDIFAWYKENGSDYHASVIQKYADNSEEEVNTFLARTDESSNVALKVLLTKQNGNLWLLDGAKTLTLGRTIEFSGNGRVVIGTDMDGSFLALEKGLLVMTDKSGNKEQDLKQTLGQYLEGLRDKMLTGKVMFDADCGLMEMA